MREYEAKLRDFLKDAEAEHLSFETSCHSVPDAAKAAGASVEAFVKNICMITDEGKLIVAIVKGEDNASSKRVGKALEIERPRVATPEEILKLSGFPCGGTPSFGFDAIFLVDPKVMECPVVYTGGGSEYSLVKIAPDELVRLNGATVSRIRR